MARKISANKHEVVWEYTGGGRVIGSITKLPRNQYRFAIATQKLDEVDRFVLQDFSEALKQVCAYVGTVIGKKINVRGANVDPDEPAWDAKKDLVVTYQIFKNDPEIKLTFTRYAEDGRVKADLQAFQFSDIPSGIQVKHIAMKAATLMLAYVRE
jgi:hypothetical protein